jgi:hypothetical protein
VNHKKPQPVARSLKVAQLDFAVVALLLTVAAVACLPPLASPGEMRYVPLQSWPPGRMALLPFEESGMDNEEETGMADAAGPNLPVKPEIAGHSVPQPAESTPPRVIFHLVTQQLNTRSTCGAAEPQSVELKSKSGEANLLHFPALLMF